MVTIEAVSEQPSHVERRDVYHRYITLDLIRKRSEHNECLVSTLEEIALHQEELEAVGPILGRTCGKTLRILLLQNNVINRMTPSEFRPFRSLEYLNLALNNIHVVEGISHLEFLNKLDLTLNFIHFERLDESISCMRDLRSLKELFVIGNPCAVEVISDNNSKKACNTTQNDKMGCLQNKHGWTGFRMYVVAKLPQLESLDGKPILRSERIQAIQHLRQLEFELAQLAKADQVQRERKIENKYTNDVSAEIEGNLTHHCPEDRTRISNEMAEQKLKKEARESANRPKRRGEEEFEKEQKAAIEHTRRREGKGKILQCNEGKWHYTFSEVKKTGYIQLDISIQKHLSSSLIDIDIHPTYISVVIKSKVLRLLLPTEVKSEQSVAHRSTTTGHLLLTMPKCKSKENILALGSQEISNTNKIERGQEDMPKVASKFPTRVIQDGLIVEKESKDHPKKLNQLDMVELYTMRQKSGSEPRDIRFSDSLYDYDEPPPPF